MRALFADLPEAVDNTLVVARRCAFMPTVRQPILPAFPVGAGRTEPDGAPHARGRGTRAPARGAGLQARDGSAARAQAAKPYRQRLEFELDVIIADGLSRLLPDRRRFHPVGEGRRASRSARAAARAPARSSPGR